MLEQLLLAIIVVIIVLLVCKLLQCLSSKASPRERLVVNENQHLTQLNPALLIPSTASKLVTSEVPRGKREVATDELALRLYAGL